MIVLSSRWLVVTLLVVGSVAVSQTVCSADLDSMVIVADMVGFATFGTANSTIHVYGFGDGELVCQDQVWIPAQMLSTGRVNAGFEAASLIDIDGNGSPLLFVNQVYVVEDVVTGDTSWSHPIVVYKNTWEGYEPFWNSSSVFNARRTVSHVVRYADLDGDKSLELVVATHGYGEMVEGIYRPLDYPAYFVISPKADGWTLVKRLDLPTDNDWELADVNGDGLLDIVCAIGWDRFYRREMGEEPPERFEDYRVGFFVFENQGDLEFSTVWVPGNFTSYIIDVASGDLDNDGLDEIVFASQGDPQISVWRFSGESGDTRYEEIWRLGGLGPCCGAWNVEVGDVDHDGVDEFVIGTLVSLPWYINFHAHNSSDVVYHCSCSLTPEERRGLRVYKYDENFGGFFMSWREPDPELIQDFTSLCICDHDGDGFNEIITTRLHDTHVWKHNIFGEFEKKRIADGSRSVESARVVNGWPKRSVYAGASYLFAEMTLDPIGVVPGRDLSSLLEATPIPAPRMQGGAVTNIWADLSSLGQPEAIALYDDGTHGDKRRDDGTYTAEITIESHLEGGRYPVTVHLTDEENRVSSRGHYLFVYPTSSEVVYEEGYEDWSPIPKSAIVDPRAENVCYSGNVSMFVSASSGGYVDFYPPGGVFDTFGYKSISLAIFLADYSRFHPKISVGIQGRDDIPGVHLSTLGFEFPQNQWTQVSIPLETLSAVNRSLSFIRIGGFLEGIFYMDDVNLVSIIQESDIVARLAVILLLVSRLRRGRGL